MLSGGQRTKAADYLLRSLTASILALAIVGAVIFDSVTNRRVPADLLGWGGIVVGAFIAGHYSLNGKSVGEVESMRNIATDAVTRAVETRQDGPQQPTGGAPPGVTEGATG